LVAAASSLVLVLARRSTRLRDELDPRFLDFDFDFHNDNGDKDDGTDNGGEAARFLLIVV